MASKHGYCWVVDEGQYYFNMRWTYTPGNCLGGGNANGKCGFAIQYNPGPI
jgi:hypothetical protein